LRDSWVGAGAGREGESRLSKGRVTVYGLLEIRRVESDPRDLLQILGQRGGNLISGGPVMPTAGANARGIGCSSTFVCSILCRICRRSSGVPKLSSNQKLRNALPCLAGGRLTGCCPFGV
jgi:hypothetical protein